MRRLRHHGIDAGADIKAPSTNYRLADILCAIGIPQLRRLNELLAERTRIAEGYTERLRPIAAAPVRCALSRASFPSPPRAANAAARASIPIADPCPKCQGQGRIRRSESLSVRIPPGVDNGSRLKLRGEGEAGWGGGPRRATSTSWSTSRSTTLFVRQDNDVIIELPVSFPQAALGTEVEVPTLDGKVKLKIPGPARNRARSSGSRAKAFPISTATDA